MANAPGEVKAHADHVTTSNDDDGGGYTDQGEAVLNPIQFDAETTGWVDADKDVNVQPQP